jgi:sugar (pentulose or hexulose) kinase
VTTVECVLAIDLGTGGPKVAIVAPDGTVRAWASRPVATVFVGDEGAEQDPNEMWSAIVSATRQVLAAVDASLPASFAAVAVTSQFMSVVPVAADGQPTGPCILWMDGRGAAHNQTLLNDESFMLFVERHGLIPLRRATRAPPGGLRRSGSVRRADGLRRRASHRTRHRNAINDVRSAGVRQPRLGRG